MMDTKNVRLEDGKNGRSASAVRLSLPAGRRGCGELICREMEDLKILTESVCCIAREAGYFLKEERKNFSREAVQKKQAHDYVSYVDKESEKRVVAALRELLPEAGFIAEEGSAVYHDEPTVG